MKLYYEELFNQSIYTYLKEIISLKLKGGISMKTLQMLFMLLGALLILQPVSLSAQERNPAELDDWHGKTILFFCRP